MGRLRDGETGRGLPAVCEGKKDVEVEIKIERLRN